MNITHSSLFSGIGACELAAEWMGWTNVFNCEINSFCRKILNYHFPKSISYEDITKTDFRKWRGKINVLTAGFPCQPFSCAGQRRGTDDDRYLWPEAIRVIREIRPSYVVGENVAGILTMVQPGEEVEVGREASLFGEDDRTRSVIKQEFVVETICRDLEREGYSVQPFVIPACAVGAPHRRDRVWFIAKRVATNNSDAGIETVQQEWEDGVLSNRTFTDTILRGCEWWSKEIDRERKNVRAGQRIFSTSKRFDESEFTSNSESEQSKRIGPEKPEDCQSKQVEFGGRNIEDHLAGRCNFWDQFPTTQPAIHRRDDGIPFNVDNLTIPFTRWRQESIKAYGNSMVPQVVYEIFRAIEKDLIKK